MPSSSSVSSIPLPELPSADEVKKDVVEATKSSAQSLRALVAGGVGGVFAVVVGHPFDLVKVRLQTADKGVYSGAMDVVRKTIAQNGARVSSPWGVILLGLVEADDNTGLVCWCFRTVGRSDANV